jgi:hypothetical protein
MMLLPGMRDFVSRLAATLATPQGWTVYYIKLGWIAVEVDQHPVRFLV